MANSYGPWRSVIQQKAAAFARNHLNIQQFGQANDEQVWQGATACTHTMMQFLYWFHFGKSITLNRVNQLARCPANARNADGDPRGLRPTEVQTFLSATKLPYKIVFDAPYTTLMNASKLGPVMYGMRYGSAPTWKGKVYRGIKAKAPFAQYAGRTQLTGFEDGAHAVLLLGIRTYLDSTGKYLWTVVFRKEPNHGSQPRPEKPAYDIIKSGEFRREYEDYRRVLGRRLYAVIPTKAVVK
jgi:hypothetical protein